MLSRVDRSEATVNSFSASWLLWSCMGLAAGCGGSSNPAPVEQAQMKKAQEYLGNYREQMVAANKGKSKTKAKSAENSPK